MQSYESTKCHKFDRDGIYDKAVLSLDQIVSAEEGLVPREVLYHQWSGPENKNSICMVHQSKLERYVEDERDPKDLCCHKPHREKGAMQAEDMGQECETALQILAQHGLLLSDDMKGGVDRGRLEEDATGIRWYADKKEMNQAPPKNVKRLANFFGV